jgi:putative hydrolase of the HAD superfamily
MTFPTIYTDADNTLWDTNGVYEAAQRALLEQIEQFVGEESSASDRLAYVRDYDQAIASMHHEHLRYPPNLLAHSLVLGLRGKPSREAARLVIRGGPLAGTEPAVDEFRSMLLRTPQLLPGVGQGLRLAAERSTTIYVVTEGPQDQVAHTLQQHGLTQYASQVLSATKTTSLYRRLKKLNRGALVAMVGDQLDRDIVPAHGAGLLAVWVPSAFRPKWHDAEATSAANFVAGSFLDAISWLLKTHSEQLLETRRSRSSR